MVMRFEEESSEPFFLSQAKNGSEGGTPTTNDFVAVNGVKKGGDE